MIIWGNKTGIPTQKKLELLSPTEITTTNLSQWFWQGLIKNIPYDTAHDFYWYAILKDTVYCIQNALQPICKLFTQFHN